MKYGVPSIFHLRLGVDSLSYKLSVKYYGSTLENVAYSTDFFSNVKVFDENFAWLNRAGFKKAAKRGFVNIPPPSSKRFIQKWKVKGRRKQFIFLTCLFNLNIGELDVISFNFLNLSLWNKVCRLFIFSSILNHCHITLFQLSTSKWSPSWTAQLY